MLIVEENEVFYCVWRRCDIFILMHDRRCWAQSQNVGSTHHVPHNKRGFHCGMWTTETSRLNYKALNKRVAKYQSQKFIVHPGRNSAASMNQTTPNGIYTLTFCFDLDQSRPQDDIAFDYKFRSLLFRTLQTGSCVDFHLPLQCILAGTLNSPPLWRHITQ